MNPLSRQKESPGLRLSSVANPGGDGPERVRGMPGPWVTYVTPGGLGRDDWSGPWSPSGHNPHPGDGVKGRHQGAEVDGLSGLDRLPLSSPLPVRRARDDPCRDVTPGHPNSLTGPGFVTPPPPRPASPLREPTPWGPFYTPRVPSVLARRSPLVSAHRTPPLPCPSFVSERRWRTGPPPPSTRGRSELGARGTPGESRVSDGTGGIPRQYCHSRRVGLCTD